MCVLEKVKLHTKKLHTKKFAHCVSLPRWIGLIKENVGENFYFSTRDNGADGYARQFNRKKLFLQNARETGYTSSRATIVSEILSRGKVKGNRGLVARGATLHVGARQDCRIISAISEVSFPSSLTRGDIARGKRNRKGRLSRRQRDKCANVKRRRNRVVDEQQEYSAIFSHCIGFFQGYPALHLARYPTISFFF